MTKRKQKFDFKKLRRMLPYFGVGILTLAFVAFGSISKHENGVTLSLDAFAKGDYNISVDQMSELYVVADLSDALGLASASDVASNYAIMTSMYEVGQTSDGKLEKPITNITTSRGVIKYEVKEGETMEMIAARYGLTTDQIRWSNGLKTTDIAAGKLLYLPSKAGIVYTVKSGDTLASIAEKYGSSVAEMTILNDLETSGITEGMQIVIAGGSLPETERPEYVPPVRVYYYTYLGNTSERLGITYEGMMYGLGGPYVGGQCTQWAWYRRVQSGLPVGSHWGNASSWAAMAAAEGYWVDRTPTVGAIFQSSAGWYGHVGFVEAVNADGSIVVTEMNYGYRPFSVTRSTIPANVVGNFNYIH